MNSIELAGELNLLIRARHPLITLETSEEERAFEKIREAIDKLGIQLYMWDLIDGLKPAPPTSEGPIKDTAKPIEVLTFIIEKGWPAVFVLKDFCTHLKDPVICRVLRLFIEKAPQKNQTLILIDPDTDMPEVFSHTSARIELGLPDEAELEELVRNTFKDLSQYTNVKTDLTRGQFQHIIRTLRGLTAFEAKTAISRVIVDDDCLDANDIERLLTIKRSMVRGMLEYVDADMDMDSLGGLTSLKGWLKKRSGGVSAKAKEFGLSPPRGILLLGVQGCGKSAACKAVSAAWKLPLLRLDPGALYDKFVGETERNLRKAIHHAESMSPCILWIDEIEKAFASAAAESADGGLSKRMFGTLLNWLQEHTSSVFCVATANDISALPPELVRKGRFDEVFFVDLPGQEARERIFEIHLNRRKRDPKKFNIRALADAADGFSGAEIEEAVAGSLYEAFSEDKDLTTEHVLRELDQTSPLSVTMAEKVASLRAWASNRCVMAD